MGLPEIGVGEDLAPPDVAAVTPCPAGVAGAVPLGGIIVPAVGGAHGAVEVPDRSRSDLSPVGVTAVLVVVTTEPETVHVHGQGVEPVMTEP